MLEKELDFCLQRFLLINAYADGILNPKTEESGLEKASAEAAFHANEQGMLRNFE